MSAGRSLALCALLLAACSTAQAQGSAEAVADAIAANKGAQTLASATVQTPAADERAGFAVNAGVDDSESDSSGETSLVAHLYGSSLQSSFVPFVSSTSWTEEVMEALGGGVSDSSDSDGTGIYSSSSSESDELGWLSSSDSDMTWQVTVTDAGRAAQRPAATAAAAAGVESVSLQLLADMDSASTDAPMLRWRMTASADTVQPSGATSRLLDLLLVEAQIALIPVLTGYQNEKDSGAGRAFFLDAAEDVKSSQPWWGSGSAAADAEGYAAAAVFAFAWLIAGVLAGKGLAERAAARAAAEEEEEEADLEGGALCGAAAPSTYTPPLPPPPSAIVAGAPLL